MQVAINRSDYTSRMSHALGQAKRARSCSELPDAMQEAFNSDQASHVVPDAFQQLLLKCVQYTTMSLWLGLPM